MPAIQGLLETALYVADLDRAAKFYQDLFGFERLLRDERMCALRVPASAAGQFQVLLLFVKGGTTEGSETPGGFIPPHDGEGQLHMAYHIADSELDTWREHLQQKGIAIESAPRMNNGSSLYFRDPDGHLIELATPGLWDVG